MRHRLVLAVLMALVGCVGPVRAQDPDRPTGPAERTLEQVLLDLETRGLRIVFSRHVVRPEMMVEEVPAAGNLRTLLEELLAAHGLAAIDGPDGVVVVVPATADDPEAEPEPAPTPVIVDEVVVTPSRMTLLRTEPTSRLGLSRDEILALPHLGEDFFRALTLLPGTLSNDVTAEFHVRGGRRDETQILLDGQELYDAYHLKEQDNAVSVVATATLSSAELTTGGFSAEYGDRMGGVLDMTTITPGGKPRYRIGLGSVSARLGGGGHFDEDRGSWLAGLRRGTTDYVARLLGDEDPRFWDGYVKLDYRLGGRSILRLNALGSGDELDFEKRVDGEINRLLTEYDSTYLWLTHQQVIGSDLVIDTAVSTTSIERDRRALELEDDVSFELRDLRDLDVLGLRQDWRLRLDRGHHMTWGWRWRDFDTAYDYRSTRAFDNPLALIRHDSPEGTNEFQERFEEHQESAYLTDRLQLSNRLTAELGLRFDRHSQTDESHLTPRLNLAWALDEYSVVRLAWGRYHQSQRPYELQVEDGDTSFQPVERSEHRVLGLERLAPGVGRRSPTSIRVELYQRLVKNPRRRYENLYEPINSFPELEPDRVAVVADRARAEGVEIFVRGGWGERITWWANYTWSATEDRVDGRWQPRLFDQPHSLNLDFDWRVTDRWRVNVAWRYHTGWPTTSIGVANDPDETGEPVFAPVLGPVNGERLPDYHRLDLRASRRWTLGATELSFYLDVQNLYDRENPGGFDIQIDPDEGTLESDTEAWPGLLPSLGVTVEF